VVEEGYRLLSKFALEKRMIHLQSLEINPTTALLNLQRIAHENEM
jgi:hypothetical protein